MVTWRKDGIVRSARVVLMHFAVRVIPALMSIFAVVVIKMGNLTGSPT